MAIYQRSWAEVAQSNFDLEIYVCGYEERSRYIASRRLGVGCCLILDYASDGILSYDDNKKFYSSLSGDFIPIDEGHFLKILFSKIQVLYKNISDSPRNMQILFDISSCSRRVMAQIVLLLSEKFGDLIDIACVYALSAYTSAPEDELPSYISEPIFGTLSGWSNDLSKPPCAVIGLGFEPGRALGCIDYLEIPEVRLLMPVGPDSRFVESVRKANNMLINEVGASNLFVYDPLNPADIYEKLESLLFGLLSYYRPVIIPLGPKIFALVSIAVAIHLSPRVCVWRTSAGPREAGFNRFASGDISVLSIKLPQLQGVPLALTTNPRI